MLLDSSLDWFLQMSKPNDRETRPCWWDAFLPSAPTTPSALAASYICNQAVVQIKNGSPLALIARYQQIYMPVVEKKSLVRANIKLLSYVSLENHSWFCNIRLPTQRKADSETGRWGKCAFSSYMSFTSQKLHKFAWEIVKKSSLEWFVLAIGDHLFFYITGLASYLSSGLLRLQSSYEERSYSSQVM